MLGHPAAAAHPDGRQLLPLEPNAGESLPPLSAEPLLLEHIENHPLELTQIPVQIGLMALQINHRIGHQLARHVMGDFTAAIQPVQRCRRICRIEMQVLEAGAAAERVSSRVLQQQKQLRPT